jgi:hypothetical protein
MNAVIAGGLEFFPFDAEGPLESLFERERDRSVETPGRTNRAHRLPACLLSYSIVHIYSIRCVACAVNDLSAGS